MLKELEGQLEEVIEDLTYALRNKGDYTIYTLQSDGSKKVSSTSREKFIEFYLGLSIEKLEEILGE